jgi:hypothetical protein
MVKNVEKNKKNIICCELVGNMLAARWGDDEEGIKDWKSDWGDKFLEQQQKWLRKFIEEKDIKSNKYDWFVYASLQGQLEKLCPNCQEAFQKFQYLSKEARESPENQKIIAYSLSNRELLQEVQRRVNNKKINLAYDEKDFVGLIAKNDDYFCEFSCCADVYYKEFSINAWKNPSWPESGRITLMREGVEWEVTAKDWNDSYSLPIAPSKSNQELLKQLEKLREELLKAWKEYKKEQKDYELLEEVEKRMKSKEFTKYEPELQHCFVKVKEQLKKKTQEWEKKRNNGYKNKRK